MVSPFFANALMRELSPVRALEYNVAAGILKWTAASLSSWECSDVVP